MTDDELIARAVAEAKQFDGTIDLWERPRTAEGMLVALMGNENLMRAVARHLLSRDPECVRVPMKGKVG